MASVAAVAGACDIAMRGRLTARNAESFILQDTCKWLEHQHIAVYGWAKKKSLGELRSVLLAILTGVGKIPSRFMVALSWFLQLSKSPALLRFSNKSSKLFEKRNSHDRKSAPKAHPAITFFE